MNSVSTPLQSHYRAALPIGNASSRIVSYQKAIAGWVAGACTARNRGCPNMALKTDAAPIKPAQRRLALRWGQPQMISVSVSLQSHYRATLPIGNASGRIVSCQKAIAGWVAGAFAARNRGCPNMALKTDAAPIKPAQRRLALRYAYCI